MKRQQIRIIGGTLRSRKITFLEDPLCRPTPDRVRETLFNWLGPFIQDAVCLDLFAGSGALAFEAISRGARKVVALEQNPAIAQAIKQQATTFNIQNLEVIQTDVRHFLQRPSETFDILFIDPPYHSSLLAECFTLLQTNPLIKPQALIYFESNQASSSEQIPKNWEIVREKKAGQVYFYLARSCEKKSD